MKDYSVRETCITISNVGKKYRMVLIEEAVYGEEFSMQLFTDGVNSIFAPVAQDYKRLYENDLGVH